MSTVKKIHFTYDPLVLVRIALSNYASELEGQHTKAKQFARYEYLHTMTDEELEQLLHRMVEERSLEEITLKEWKKDCEYLFSYMYETERYKELEFEYNKQGYGSTGLGVVDASDNTFYDCEFAGHWETIMKIISEKYPQYSEAAQRMYLYNDLDEYKGISRKQVDEFILESFQLIGGTKNLKQYTGPKKKKG